MTVDVGFAGQPFITEMLDKIAEAKRLREENGWHYRIMIDGSCNKKTFKRLYDAGAGDLYPRHLGALQPGRGPRGRI